MATPKKVHEGTRTGMVRARITPELKSKAEAILERVGLSASDAIRLFYTQVTLSDGLPFDVRIPNAETRQAIREARTGQDITIHESPAELFDKLGL